VQHDGVTTLLDVDHLVVGAGAMGMAFTDALVDHSDARVAIVDRHHAAGGHWLDVYPFVRLHQASALYGVPSTVLGGGRTQTTGPEAGLHERATAPEIVLYFERALRRLEETGRVRFLGGCERVGDRQVVSNVSGERFEVPPTARIVDATYLAPAIPASTPPPFEVGDGVRVEPVNALVGLDEAPSQYVVVGSGKTATDACFWLLENGVDPDAICWVRPRDPWMINRAVVQPDPLVWQRMVGDLLESAAGASSPEDFFLRLEAAGVMLRIDPTVMPTMARAPTLAQHELEAVRRIEHVVRLGHLRRVETGRLVLDHGEATIAADALVVHCAASGLQNPPVVPIWQPDAVRLQLVRAGVPSFNAALAGFVEATVADEDEKNRLCPPTPYSNSLASWALFQAMGSRAVASYMSDPDVAAWAHSVSINPARLPPEGERSDELRAAVARVGDLSARGLAGLDAIAAMG
jgi:hypothetical protein